MLVDGCDFVLIPPASQAAIFLEAQDLTNHTEET